MIDEFDLDQDGEISEAEFVGQTVHWLAVSWLKNTRLTCLMDASRMQIAIMTDDI